MNPATMRKLATTIGVVSLLAALVFTGMLIKNTRSGEKPPAEEEATVVVPTVQIARHERLSSSAGKFQVKRIEKSRVAPDAVTSLDELDGKYALEVLPTTNYVTTKQIGTQDELGVMSATLRPGYRAMTVPADRLSVINGALKPNDYVDVIAAMEAGQGVTVSKVVLQNVRVLAVGAETAANTRTQVAPQQGQQAAAPTDAPAQTTITLEVRPEDAVKLVLAQSKGKLQMVLRGIGQGSYSSVRPVYQDELIPGPRKPAATQVAANPAPQAPRGGGPRVIYRDRYPSVSPAAPTRFAPTLPPAPLIYGPAAREQTKAPEHTVTILRGNDKSTQTFTQ